MSSEKSRDDTAVSKLVDVSDTDDPLVVYREAPRKSDAGKYHKVQSTMLDGKFSFVSTCATFDPDSQNFVDLEFPADELVVERESEVPDEYDRCRRPKCWPNSSWPLADEQRRENLFDGSGSE